MLLLGPSLGCIIVGGDDAPGETEAGSGGQDDGSTGPTSADGTADESTGGEGICPTPPTGDVAPQALDCSAFAGDLVLHDDPERPVDYVLECRANVGGALSIEAGTVIELGPDAGISVTDTGSIEAVGTDCDPVVLRGTSSTPGGWLGLQIDSGSPVNRLEHVRVEGAGGGQLDSNGDLGSVLVTAQSQLTLRDTAIADGAARGLHLGYPEISLTLEGSNVISGHADSPVWVGAYLVPAMDPAALQIVDNPGGDIVHVWVSEIGDGERAWPRMDVPYRIGSRDEIFKDVIVSEGQSLLLEDGTQILMEPDTGIEVSGGSLLATGVTLVGADPTPGSWKGIYLLDPNEGEATHELHGVEIAHAGGGQFNSNGALGAIIVNHDTELTLTDSLLHDNASSCVINRTHATSQVDELGNTYESNEGAPVCDP